VTADNRLQATCSAGGKDALQFMKSSKVPGNLEEVSHNVFVVRLCSFHSSQLQVAKKKCART